MPGVKGKGNLLQNKYGLDELTSGKIAQMVWSQLKTKDVRDVLAIAKLTKSSEDVEFDAHSSRGGKSIFVLRRIEIQMRQPNICKKRFIG